MFKRILVLAPHIDDGELGCGGTISRLLRDNAEVYYAAFSAAEGTCASNGMERDILKREVLEAINELKIKKENIRLYGYEVRKFPIFRQEILDDLIKLKNEIKPDVIFTPSLNDIHQDHQVVSIEAVRAFKTKTILGYEMPWNNLTINTTCFFKLSLTDVEKKMRALQCYKSQSTKDYFHPNFIRSLLMTRGVQIGCEFAEVFEIIRCVV